MDNNTLIVVGLIAVGVVVVAAVLFLRNRSSVRLRERFGPEYDRAVDDSSGRREAEAELHEREKRVEAFAIKPLGPGEQDRYRVSWRTIQEEFVDNPERAVAHADELLGDVMLARGYPVGEFEQRSADLSVDHPVVVQNYRAAHEIALRRGRGEAGTEDLRQAMIHFRTLFDELVSETAPANAKAA